MEQFKLHFRGYPLVDTSFKEYDVHLYQDSFDKSPVFVSGIWAESREQAIVKAAIRARVQKYSINYSQAVPKIKPKGFL